jgi:site-specific recombinase XerD
MPIDPSRIRVLGPLAEFATGFANELARQGYTPNSAGFQMRLLAHLSRWLREHGLAAGDLHMSEMTRFLRSRRAAGYATLLSMEAMQPIIGYLRGLGAAPPPAVNIVTGPVEVMLERYRRYMATERAVLNSTANRYVCAVRPFFDKRVSPDNFVLKLNHLTAADIISFVTSRCARQTSGAAKWTVRSLRSLLGFLHVAGVIERPLASVVPSVANRQSPGLPKGLAPDQVQRLLASCDDRTRSGCRDIAILTMLVRLGLRAVEISRLRLNDIDWRAGEITVRGKGNCTERLPLPADVGDLVVAYLLHGRPASAQGRAVFVRIWAPHCSLSPQGVSSIVSEAARRAGLGRIHAHRLRHTAATQMLRAGASLQEVGQLLRHRYAMTTAIYAKVDREALRTIARRWPGDVA